MRALNVRLDVPRALAALDLSMAFKQQWRMYRIIGADGKEYGPVTLEQLRQWVQEGRANAQTRVLPEGASGWTALGSLPEFTASAPGSFPSSAGSAQPFSTYEAPRRTHPLAIAGLVLGIVSLTIGMCCCYGLPMNLLGLIFSLVAWSQIRNQPDIYNGAGLAIAGTITSAFSLLLAAGLTVTFGIGAVMDAMRGQHF